MLNDFGFDVFRSYLKLGVPRCPSWRASLPIVACLVAHRDVPRFLSYPQYLSHLDGVGLVPLVQFAERLQPDAVELGNVEEALVHLHDVDWVLAELARGTVALLLQVDDVASRRRVVARQVVVFVEFAQAQASLLADGGHIVTHLDDDEEVLVVLIDNVTAEELVNRFGRRSCVCCRSRLCRAVLAIVELVQIVHLNDADEGFRIGGTSGVACCLQPASPALVVGGMEPVETLVALLLQEPRVVNVALAGTLVLAELLVAGIIVAQDVRACPRAAHLDAEVVVGFCCKSAASGVALQQALCQSDAGRNLELVHLLNGPVLVFVNVRPISLIGTLCLQKQAN